MPRICSGCLEPKPIVNDQEGYCEYCDSARNISISQIFKRLEILDNLSKFKTKKDLPRRHKKEML